MHILFVHQNFPAQFGHLAQHLVQNHGFRCTFACDKPAGHSGGIERIQYVPTGGATAQTHYCTRTMENQIWHSQALYETLRKRPDIQPDLVVGHTGFVSTLFLRELYSCPTINYFEYYYHATNSDMDFRRDLPACPPLDRLRARARNAMLLLDLDNCDAGYSPTQWQRERLPAEFQGKLSTIFDGIDTTLWRRTSDVPPQFGGYKIPAGHRLVTYVSRGMESMRGFDIFMKVAKRICDQRSDVTFVVVGEDRVAYGGDARYTGGQTFKQWVLAQDNYDLSRILFIGRLPPAELAGLLSATDLHIYLTVPFVLSWSLMNALACGATVLASDTAPVCEMIHHEQNGLLCDFFDVDGLVDQAQQVLADPPAFVALGQAGIEMIHNRYRLELCLDQMLDLYRRVTSEHLAQGARRPHSGTS